MKEMEQRLRQTLQQQLMLIEQSRRYPFADFSLIRRIAESLNPAIANLIAQLIEGKEGLIRELETDNRKLKAKLNQMTFGNDPMRDNEILELYKQGLSRGRIAKAVGMSKPGVTKALKRLGVNSGDSG